MNKTVFVNNRKELTGALCLKGIYLVNELVPSVVEIARATIANEISELKNVEI